MKKIIYYVTDHGLGHATRSVALIRELQKYNLEIIVRNSNAKHFLKNSLEHTRIVSDKTDVGPLIKNDGISINETKSKPIIKEWIDSNNTNVKPAYFFRLWYDLYKIRKKYIDNKPS